MNTSFFRGIVSSPFFIREFRILAILLAASMLTVDLPSLSCSSIISASSTLFFSFTYLVQSFSMSA